MSQLLVNGFTALPDPGQAGTLDNLVERLRLLKVWAGDPSYQEIRNRINTAWTASGRPASELVGKTTVVDCFRPGRRRLNNDLVVAVVRALHPDAAYVSQWQQTLQAIGGHATAALQVRVQDELPPDPADFTGRETELAQLLRSTRTGGVAAIDGMPGVGKTLLAIRAGHLLAHDRVLFVNLRGFHPDPAQPPAEPTAVLDGFLRLLGMPGGLIPYDLPARTTAYRKRLAGTRTLVVLDNAASEDQLRPLLPETPGCPVLITSRHAITTVPTRLTLDVFTPDEALDFLNRTAPEVPIGPDPTAPTRITDRGGYLPLALELFAVHIRTTPGWTLTDHADRLDERHGDRRLDSGVQLALDLSYQQLPPAERHMLRLAALHPGQDLTAPAAAALSGADLSTAQASLHRLYRDHLLQSTAPGRYTLHDLVRVYATNRAGDEDAPPARHAALTRLFDHYLAAAGTAADPLSFDPAWLDTELPNLVAIAAYTATEGWPSYTIRLSRCLFRYLDGGHLADAMIIHGHAAQLAEDVAGQAHALINLGATYTQLSRYEQATEHLQQARSLCRQAGDLAGEARALHGLGIIELDTGRYRRAAEHHEQARDRARQAGDHAGEARALISLAAAEERTHQYPAATDHLHEALRQYRRLSDRAGEALALNGLGMVETQLGRHDQAAGMLRQALALFQQLGDRTHEAWTLESLGTLHLLRDEPTQSAEYYGRALAIVRETGDRHTEAWALNGLGEAAHQAGRRAEARSHHTEALAVAGEIGDQPQLARAQAGLGMH